jgi:hypothetical protein
MTLNAGLPWQQQYSTKEGYFHLEIGLKVMEVTN